MFSPEKDLSRKIIELLGTDGMSISSLDKELSKQGIKDHRLVLTGYLRAMTDLGYLKMRDVPPAKIYVPAKRLPDNIYDTISAGARRLSGVDTDEVILYCLGRLFRRPVFESELRRCGVMRPVGERADQDAVNDASKVLKRAGNVVPSDLAYVPVKEYPAEFDAILSDAVLEATDSSHLVMTTKQTKLF
ncbi:MAG: hypothetical protein ACOX8X_03875 [Methanomethylophilus sp.]|jgi:hypothetical protein